ncbi:hypothetical protein M408DRAFT_31008 [Serendipita vermifera MAFF 305830]|uniref:F-box domain-containing protein n=1 Tax=Serendipita vermifera MAFF 305830 TaxID=933852 RepID=A0A0C2VZH1_SERVB|nr:hypothetical protein M408DRAFT_31008 [Serendipita vermifera MAFF 305830]
MESSHTPALMQPVSRNQVVIQHTTGGQTQHFISLRSIRDPISVLLPEIAWRCIFEALPSEEDEYGRVRYPSVLLQLMTVSHSWQDFIISTSSFWDQIYIDNWTDDFLAKLAVFLSLSRKRKLELIIYDYTDEEWDQVRALLLPHVSRIQVLTILSREKSLAIFDEPTRGKLLVTSFKYKDLDLASFLKELNFSEDWTVSAEHLSPFALPFHIKITSLISSPLKGDALDHQGLKNCIRLSTNSHLNDIVPALDMLPNLSTLEFGFGTPYGSVPRTVERNSISSSPPHLKSITSDEQPYCPNLGRLIVFTASRLTSLSIQITVSEIGEVVGILPLLTKLQTLGLAFHEMGQISDTPYDFPHTVISSLQRILIRVATSLDYNLTSLDGLFAALSILYTRVAKVTFDGSSITSMAGAYLQGLQHLETLKIVGNSMALPKKRRELFLPTLQELEAWNYEQIKFVRAPNLISLRVWGVKSGRQIAQLQYYKLQSLKIHTRNEVTTTLVLRPTTLTELKRLFITLRSWNDRWTLRSFPLLVSLHLTAVSAMNFAGNMLCAQLMYHPEMCPSLREINFGNYVEWDLLFIMLEQRNLGQKNVTRIGKVRVPFVPFEFRQSLLDILFGRQRQDGPSNMVLSLEETRELICDPSM